jgi:O-antigen/teichoic acid export membrane protein
LRLPLFRNGYALILGAGASSVLGMFYWLLAARIYSPGILGLNSAMISALMLLSEVSQLNLTSAMIRFLPRAGSGARQLVRWAYICSSISAITVSVVFVVGIPLWAPALEILRSNVVIFGLFSAATVLWGIFALQDDILIGLRRAVWVPVENFVFTLLKIVLLLLFAHSLSGYGIFASWVIPAALAVLPMNLLIFRRFLPAHARHSEGIEEPLVARQIVSYVAADYLGLLFRLMSTTLLPLIVIQSAGADATAYFSLTWTVAFPLQLIMELLSISLTVESSGDITNLGRYARRVLFQALRLLVIPVALLSLGAPYFLAIFGESYAAGGGTLLRFLALAAIPNAINVLYLCVARVQKRMVDIIVVQAALATLVLGLGFALLHVFGIAGIGLAWLIGQTVVACVLLATRLRGILYKLGTRTGENT